MPHTSYLMPDASCLMPRTSHRSTPPQQQKSHSSSATLLAVSDTTTRGIRIEVESAFIPERSEPGEAYYFFAYHVRISNVGDEAAQLISREWIITDSDGNEERVAGAGVVGEQPLLAPGASFEYTSFCPLRTSVGSMHGSYTMRPSSGETFQAEIGAFTLAVPGVVN
jgi:ApaG protein